MVVALREAKGEVFFYIAADTTLHEVGGEDDFEVGVKRHGVGEVDACGPAGACAGLALVALGEHPFVVAHAGFGIEANGYGGTAVEADV